MGKKIKQPHASNLCGAKTRNGTPCKNHAMKNGRCRMHGGKSTGSLKNKNAVKHGVYKSIFFDTLEDDEMLMIEDMSFEEERLLIDEISLLSVRERRLLKIIEKYKNNIELPSITTRKLDIKGNITKGSKQSQTEIINSTASAFDIFHKAEAELTRIQAKKTKCISELGRIRMERESNEGGSDLVNEWIAGVLNE